MNKAKQTIYAILITIIATALIVLMLPIIIDQISWIFYHKIIALNHMGKMDALIPAVQTGNTELLSARLMIYLLMFCIGVFLIYLFSKIFIVKNSTIKVSEKEKNWFTSMISLFIFLFSLIEFITLSAMGKSYSMSNIPLYTYIGFFIPVIDIITLLVTLFEPNGLESAASLLLIAFMWLVLIIMAGLYIRKLVVTK